MEGTTPFAWVQALAETGWLETLFDRLPDVVFFAKDHEGRYVLVNQTLLSRCGIEHKRSLLGKTAEEVFPGPMGTGYTAQDRTVLQTGLEIRDKLELHTYPSGRQGWCLTFKAPLRLSHEIVGLVGISRDLHAPDERHPEYRLLAQAIEYVQKRYGEPIRQEALAREVGLSLDRFERLARQVLQLTPRQLLTKTRIEAASHLLLESRLSIAEIAQTCGYSDHSAFTRQFRATVGLTPGELRSGAKPSK